MHISRLSGEERAVMNIACITWAWLPIADAPAMHPMSIGEGGSARRVGICTGATAARF